MSSLGARILGLSIEQRAALWSAALLPIGERGARRLAGVSVSQAKSEAPHCGAPSFCRNEKHCPQGHFAKFLFCAMLALRNNWKFSEIDLGKIRTDEARARRVVERGGLTEGNPSFFPPPGGKTREPRGGLST